PNVLGRSVVIDGTGYTIVGVMPAGFRHYHAPGMGERTWYEMFLSDPWAFNPRTNRWMWAANAIGRLKPGIALAGANAEVKALAASTDYGAPPSSEWNRPQ